MGRVSGKRRLPAAIWALGLVSLLMDTSSELIHSLLPAFLVTTVGVSALTVGVIEGIAESTAAMTKLFSGVLADHFGRRKPLAVLGYGLAALTKPVFPLARTAWAVLGARFVDRIGKGIRGAPRDALVADLAPPESRGAAYGLRQALDSVGAVAGPLAAVGLMALFADDMRTVFWFATLPAVLAVAVLVFLVHEPAHEKAEAKPSPLAGFRFRTFPREMWALVVIVALFTLMRFSEAFLVLRAEDRGWPLGALPFVFVVMNATYALSAYPLGVLSDRVSRTLLLAVGCGVMVLADACLAFWPGWLGVGVGVAIWGLHMGLTEGLLSALVADRAPKDTVGTAFGVVNFTRGVMLLLASVLAGGLWKGWGPEATFLAGGAFAFLTLVALLFLEVQGRLTKKKPTAE